MFNKDVLSLLVPFLILLGLTVSGVFDYSDPQKHPLPTYSPVALQPAPSKTPWPKITIFPSRTPPVQYPASPSPNSSNYSSPAPSPSPSHSPQTFQAVGDNGIPFGGKVKNNIGCSPHGICSCGGADELIEVGDPRGGTFALNGKTIFYEFNNWTAPNWVLGLAYTYYDTCYIDEIDPITYECYCVSIGSGPAVNIMGTSKK